MKGLLLKDYYNIRSKLWIMLIPFIIPVIYFIVTPLPINSFEIKNIKEDLEIFFVIGIILTPVLGLALFLDSYSTDCGSEYMKQAFVSPSGRMKYMEEKYVFAVIGIIASGFVYYLFMLLIISCISHDFTGTFRFMLDFTKIAFMISAAVIMWIVPASVCFDIKKLLLFLVVLSILTFTFWFFAELKEGTTDEIIYDIMKISWILLSLASFVGGWFMVKRREV